MRRGRSAPRLHVVLLAGGSGTRFWPLSRADRPKQFLRFSGSESLLEATWRRVSSLAPPDRIWVVAPAALRASVRRALPGLRKDRLIVEPTPRDTAPAIALACFRIAAHDPEAIAAVFPTDHVVRDASRFRSAVRAAARAARANALVCLGIRPDRPATGFGYLKCARPPRNGAAVPVERFVEKPSVARARRFVASRRYLWNGGMFVWRVERFLRELGTTAPRIHDAVSRAARGDRRSWSRAERKSVDYAVMEKAEGVRVVPLDAGWDDVGSWDAAARLRESEVSRSRAIVLDSPGTVVFESSRTVAVVGVPGVLVVDTEDALLVVARGASEKVREVVAALRSDGREDLL